MSKYSEEFCEQMKNVGGVKKATQDLLAKNNKIAFEEIHEAGSLERLKKKLREDY